MNLLPADIILIRRGTAWMPFAPAIWLWQRIADPTTPWSWAYHVEMVWDLMPDGYRAFSLQPPVLQVVQRKFSDIRFTAYRLKDRPETSEDSMNHKLWRWGNLKILHQPYLLGISTCGHPIEEFYHEFFGIELGHYPASIEDYCKTSGRFVRVG